MDNCIIDLHYLPCIAYFEVIKQYKKVIFDIGENYQKQTYRNRCQILTAQKKLNLSIPILHQLPKMPFKDIKIDYQQKWQRTHWRTIVTNYAKSPFFIHYEHYFEKIFENQYEFLYQWNLDLFKICIQILKIPIEIEVSDVYIKNIEAQTKDLRNNIIAKKTQEISQKPYLQVFGNEFVPNLSIIDLIFCENKLD
ncbi:MAG: hypothetical protein EAZ85_08295 [Bacteroidetes bacterium]|nr:MAG: hypothetical protein EAZ85_08295 [Bacteroidota bacterium]TAG89199.1 MAG: hypothetical protein EAZ20_06950 [Bacteroidota bacterium]